jgi:hypothetical protein
MPTQTCDWVQEAKQRALKLHPWLFDKTILVSRAELGKWCKFDWFNDPPLTKLQLAQQEWKQVKHEREVNSLFLCPTGAMKLLLTN